ncbi:(+)-neomenthol dehydrogenase-like [Impatiens glandulifera]|uniref:(+)-neomenthol dehydrogenase-like n=1 Tax=Impatiens glandulifera TaxID=253017 RepID=UPI001FB18D4A|nr:(+)-neomenthol dehydrogenase-like [Impatiens glandulifera]
MDFVSYKTIHIYKIRCAIVTGANRGLGLEVCRQLAITGVTVVLTARDEQKGLEALKKLKESAGNENINVIFHRLDVADPSTIPPLVDFVLAKFGKLDILVNNAGVVTSKVDWESLKDYILKPEWSKLKLSEENYENAEECLQVNYYGMKRMVEAFVPLLQRSNSPRIVNVSSLAGKLQNLPNEWAKGVLNDATNLSEERIEEVLNKFLKDFKEGTWEANGWPTTLTSYILTKATLNAYTRVVAKKFPTILVNCVCPGCVKTNINDNTGTLTVEEGAESFVRLALLPDDGSTGTFYCRAEVSSFE